VGVTPRSTLDLLQGFMPRVKQGGFVLQRPTQPESDCSGSLSRMASRPERPRACFSHSKQRQQMWQAVAAGGSTRQDSKQACMRAERGSYPSVCACVHTETHDVAVKRWGLACLSRPTCHPWYKNRPKHTKTKGQTRKQDVICARSPCYYSVSSHMPG